MRNGVSRLKLGFGKKPLREARSRRALLCATMLPLLLS